MHRIALRTPALFPKPQVKNTLRIPIYQLDAFASAPFKGNPAAVCPLDAWLRRSHAVCPTACTLGPAQASPPAMRGWLWARSAARSGTSLSRLLGHPHEWLRTAASSGAALSGAALRALRVAT